MHPLDSVAGTNLEQQRRGREGELRDRQLARIAKTAHVAQKSASKPKHPATPGRPSASGCPTPPCLDGTPSAQPA